MATGSNWFGTKRVNQKRSFNKNPNDTEDYPTEIQKKNWNNKGPRDLYDKWENTYRALWTNTNCAAWRLNSISQRTGVQKEKPTGIFLFGSWNWIMVPNFLHLLLYQWLVDGERLNTKQIGDANGPQHCACDHIGGSVLRCCFSFLISFTHAGQVAAGRPWHSASLHCQVLLNPLQHMHSRFA